MARKPTRKPAARKSSKTVPTATQRRPTSDALKMLGLNDASFERLTALFHQLVPAGVDGITVAALFDRAVDKLPELVRLPVLTVVALVRELEASAKIERVPDSAPARFRRIKAVRARARS